jgi:protein CpxP
LSLPALRAQEQNASQQPAAGPRQAERQRARRELFQGIKLTDEQRQQMRDLRQQREPQLKAEAQQLREAQRALLAAQHASPIDDAVVKQQQEQARKLRQQVAASRKELRDELLKLLTPEQRQQLKAQAGRKGRAGR